MCSEDQAEAASGSKEVIMVYNSVPWSQQAEIFIYMTDWGADLGIVSAITSPRVRTHSYISLLFSHFHLKYVEQKRKKKITQRRRSTYKIYKVLHQNQLPHFMRTLICCCTALLFKAP